MKGSNPYPLLVRRRRGHQLRAEDATTWSVAQRVAESARRRFGKRARRRKVSWLFERARRLSPAPEAGPSTSTPQPHMLVCSAHLEMAIVAAKSLMLAAGRPLRLNFHDDGSLTSRDVQRLTHELPGCRVIRRAEADARAERVLADYPTLRQCRARNVLMLKVVDLAIFAEHSRILSLDADVVFFARPEALLSAAEQASGVNLFMRDLASAYARPSAVVSRELGAACTERVNTGLFVMNRDDVSWSRLEAWLSAPVFADQLSAYLIEQQLLGMLGSASPQGLAFWPDAYDMQFTEPVESLVCRHYAGYFRQGFALEALAYLFDERELDARWRAFAPRPSIVIGIPSVVRAEHYLAKTVGLLIERWQPGRDPRLVIYVLDAEPRPSEHPEMAAVAALGEKLAAAGGSLAILEPSASHRERLAERLRARRVLTDSETKANLDFAELLEHCAHTGAEHVLFLEDDVEPSRGYLRKALALGRRVFRRRTPPMFLSLYSANQGPPGFDRGYQHGSQAILYRNDESLRAVIAALRHHAGGRAADLAICEATLDGRGVGRNHYPSLFQHVGRVRSHAFANPRDAGLTSPTYREQQTPGSIARSWLRYVRASVAWRISKKR